MAKLYKLSPLQVSKTTKLGWLADGGGLYLRTRKSGTKSWIFRYERNQKKMDFTLGPLTSIGLAKAREMAAECRLAIIEGRSLDSLFAEKASPKTFRDAALAIIERRQKSWKSDKTSIKWRRGLIDHCKPIHTKQVQEITIQDVEMIIEPIWYSNNHSARMIRGMIEQALDLATVLGWRSGDNPARWKGRLEHLLPDYMPQVKHHSAMPYSNVPNFMSTLLSSDHRTRFALAFTILTASRGHMVRHATWDEFNFSHSIWTIPAHRMKKSDEDHVVPLTRQMISVLPETKSGLVFPYRGKGFSENAFRSTLKAMGFEYTAHGFRSSFKDWASDKTDYPDETSELVLAHKVGSKVRRSYRRGTGLDKRQQIMSEWSNFCFGRL